MLVCQKYSEIRLIDPLIWQALGIICEAWHRTAITRAITMCRRFVVVNGYIGSMSHGCNGCNGCSVTQKVDGTLFSMVMVDAQ